MSMRPTLHLQHRRYISLDSRMAKQRKLEAQLRLEIHKNILSRADNDNDRDRDGKLPLKPPRVERESMPHSGSFLSPHQWSLAMLSPLQLYSEDSPHASDQTDQPQEVQEVSQKVQEKVHQDQDQEAPRKASSTSAEAGAVSGSQVPSSGGVVAADQLQLELSVVTPTADSHKSTKAAKNGDPRRVSFKKLRACLESRDWGRYKRILLVSVKAKTPVPVDILAPALHEMWVAQQYSLITWCFERFEPSIAEDSESLVVVVQAAFRQNNFQMCEYIAEKYSHLLENNPVIIDCMLRSFLHARDFTFAKAYLQQVWDNVPDSSVLAYLTSSAKHARDPRELQRVFFAWYEKRTPSLSSSQHNLHSVSSTTKKITPATTAQTTKTTTATNTTDRFLTNINPERIYVATLNGLLDLDYQNTSAFKAVLDAYRSRVASISKSPPPRVLPLSITQVLMYRALINNDSRLALDLALEWLESFRESESGSGSGSESPTLRDILSDPFARAGVYYAWHKDVNKLQWLLDTMAEMSLRLETHYANDLLLALLRFPRFKLVDGIDLLVRHKVRGSAQTARTLFAMLMNQSPESAHRLYSGLPSSSSASCEKDVENVQLHFCWRRGKSSRSDTGSGSGSGQSPELALLRTSSSPAEISSVLETLARNGRNVPVSLLLDAGMAAARSTDASLLARIVDSVEKSSDAAHVLPALRVKIAFLELVAAVETLKTVHQSDPLDPSQQHRPQSGSRRQRIARLLCDFVQTYGFHSHLGLKQRTYIGQQLMYCRDYTRAIAVLDSLRLRAASEEEEDVELPPVNSDSDISSYVDSSAVPSSGAPISLLNHDSSSLASMCKALSHCNEFTSLLRLVEMISGPHTDFVLQPVVFNALENCRSHMVSTLQQQQQHIIDKFDSLVERLRALNAIKIEKDLETGRRLCKLAESWGLHLTKR